MHGHFTSLFYSSSCTICEPLHLHLRQNYNVVFFKSEVLNREIFDTLYEDKVLVERWRNEYNHQRLHSALGYRPTRPRGRHTTGYGYKTSRRYNNENIDELTNLKSGLNFRGRSKT